jgi:hypothetical protein
MVGSGANDVLVGMEEKLVEFSTEVVVVIDVS